GFSGTIPRAVTSLGALFAVVGLIAAFYFLLNAIFFSPLPGWSTIMVILSFFFGIVFLILGTICEYLLRIYVEATRRPLYFIAADTAKDDFGLSRRQHDPDRRKINV